MIVLCNLLVKKLGLALNSAVLMFLFHFVRRVCALVKDQGSNTDTIDTPLLTVIHTASTVLPCSCLLPKVSLAPWRFNEAWQVLENLGKHVFTMRRSNSSYTASLQSFPALFLEWMQSFPAGTS
jgi:hypothetical protein